MAIFYGKESDYINEIKRHSHNKATWLIILFFLLFSLYLYNFTELIKLSVLPSFVFFVIFVSSIKIIELFIDRQLVRKWKAARGLEGEREVFETLSKLPDTYSVFRGLNTTNKYDIDFLVIGPTGVFAIEVKSHKGILEFDGEKLKINSQHFKEKDILRQAFKNAMDLNSFLKEQAGIDIFVTPVIIFSDQKTYLKFGMKKIKNVYVINNKWTIELLTKQKNVGVDIELLREVLSKYTN